MNQKEFTKILLIILVIVIIGGIVGYFVFVQKQGLSPTTPPISPENGVHPSITDIPLLIKNITIDSETGSQKPENDFQIMEQIKEKIINGELLWFKDPVEVSKKYGSSFGISGNAQYTLEEQGTEIGEYSGLFQSTVLAVDGSKSYRIALISEPEAGKPSIWVINAVVDVQQENKLRVTFFNPVSTYDTDGISYQDIVSRFGDGTTVYYLNVRKPVVNFYLNQPANPSTVSSGSIIVKANNMVFSGATAKAVTEQGSSHGATFPMYSIQIDLSNISNLNNYAGQNIQIILTDKIKDQTGDSLQQCNRSYNKGECIEDSSGQKIKVFGVEIKLYSLE